MQHAIFFADPSEYRHQASNPDSEKVTRVPPFSSSRMYLVQKDVLSSSSCKLRVVSLYLLVINPYTSMAIAAARSTAPTLVIVVPKEDSTG